MSDLAIPEANSEPSLYADIKALTDLGNKFTNEVTITVEPNRVTIKGHPLPAAQVITELTRNGLRALG